MLNRGLVANHVATTAKSGGPTKPSMQNTTGLKRSISQITPDAQSPPAPIATSTSAASASVNATRSKAANPHKRAPYRPSSASGG